jgi:8-oxo-dGTP pyrophosphatase MutT (NUDIX family)
MQQQPPSSVTTSPDISDFLISPTAFLANRPDVHNIISGAVVFRSRSNASDDDVHEVLLLKRAPSDSFALKWETPGGTADPIVDQSLVGVAVRELWEETQLRARRVSCAVGLGLPAGVDNIVSLGEVTDARMDKEHDLCLLRLGEVTWAIGTFIVDVEDTEAQIVLRDDEHVKWAWVSEAEIDKRGFQSGKELEFVSEAMRMIVLEAFRLKRKGII